MCYLDGFLHRLVVAETVVFEEDAVVVGRMSVPETDGALAGRAGERDQFFFLALFGAATTFFSFCAFALGEFGVAVSINVLRNDLVERLVVFRERDFQTIFN